MSAGFLLANNTVYNHPRRPLCAKKKEFFIGTLPKMSHRRRYGGMYGGQMFGPGWDRPGFGPHHRRRHHHHGCHRRYYQQVYIDPTPVVPIVAPTRTIANPPPTPPPRPEPTYAEIVPISDDPPPYPGSIKEPLNLPKPLRKLSQSHYEDPIPLETLGKESAYVLVPSTLTFSLLTFCSSALNVVIRR